MFAFAIWDATARRLLLARDRVGKKPLYWREDGASLAFGSELKALVADPAVTRRIDPVALHHYLTYQYVPAPWSIYHGIQKLPPGHLLSWQDGVTKVSRYWRLDSTERPVTSVPEAAEQLRSLLLDATKVRMLSERPLGAFLSGGLDSSAVVAAMARQTSGPVKTFSIGFENAQVRRAVACPAARRVLRNRSPGIRRDPGGHGRAAHAGMALRRTLRGRLSDPEFLCRPYEQPAGDCRTHRGRRRRVLRGLPALRADGHDRPDPGAPDRRPRLHDLGSFVVRHSRPGSWPRSAGRIAEVLGQPVPRRYARIMSYFTPEQKLDLYTGALRDLARRRGQL